MPMIGLRFVLCTTILCSVLGCAMNPVRVPEPGFAAAGRAAEEQQTADLYRRHGAGPAAAQAQGRADAARQEANREPDSFFVWLLATFLETWSASGPQIPAPRRSP
jgi:hypothetical protein